MKVAEEGDHPRVALFSLSVPDEAGLFTGHDDQPGGREPPAARHQLATKLFKRKAQQRSSQLQRSPVMADLLLKTATDRSPRCSTATRPRGRMPCPQPPQPDEIFLLSQQPGVPPAFCQGSLLRPVMTAQSGPSRSMLRRSNLLIFADASRPRAGPTGR